MPTTTIHVYGAKGGVGTTTVAALIALEHHSVGHTVVLTAAALPDGSDGDQGDLHAVLGRASTGEPITFPAAGGSTVTVIDHGTTPPAGDLWATRNPGDRVYLVIRACYLGIRRALAQNCRPDGIILLAEQGRSLGARDVEDVLGVKVVATLAVTESMARSIDAGLLSHHARRRPLGLAPLPLAA
jgi:nucleoside-diphosphate-sugar epimerase